MTTRAAWKAASAELASIEAERDALLAPTKERFESARQAVSDIEDAIGCHLGNCVACAEPIFEGEKYHTGVDEPMCEACAPTYGDMLASPDSFFDFNADEPMTADVAKQRVDAHLAAGGALTDKMVSA